MNIIAVRKDENGDNKEFKLDNDQIVSVKQAINLCKKGELPGYNIGRSKSGSEFIRGNADGDENNNLDKLPTF